MTLQPDAPHPDDDAEVIDADDLREEVVEDAEEEQGEAPETDAAGAEPAAEDARADLEARARALGWEPPAELAAKGRTPKHGVIDDPAEWITRFEQNVPVLTAANKRLEDELKKVRSSVDEKVARETNRAVKAAKAAFDRQLKSERDGLVADYDAWIAQGAEPREIRRRMAAKDQALTKADEAAAKARETEFGDDEDQAQQDGGPSPEWRASLESFVERNSSWYGENGNRGMMARATEIAVEVDRSNKFASNPDGAFAEIERRMKAEYADHPVFKQTRRVAPKVTAVATNGGRGLNGGASTPAMSDEDKAAFEIIFKQGAYGDPKKTDRKKAMAEYLEDSKEG